MNEHVAYAVAIFAALVAAFAAVHTMRNQLFSNPLFYAIATLELLLVVLLVSGCVALGKTDRDVDGVLFVSYLVTVVVIPPAAVLWGIAEKSRWGTGVVVVAMLSVAVLAIRLLRIWDAVGV
ncbi:MAG: hypothetical protein ABIR57_14465 [Aeromicrobium sp.]